MSPEPPNPFIAGEAEYRLLCCACRKRLGLGAECVEKFQATASYSKKPLVWHRDCPSEAR